MTIRRLPLAEPRGARELPSDCEKDRRGQHRLRSSLRDSACMRSKGNLLSTIARSADVEKLAQVFPPAEVIRIEVFPSARFRHFAIPACTGFEVQHIRSRGRAPVTACEVRDQGRTVVARFDVGLGADDEEKLSKSNLRQSGKLPRWSEPAVSLD